MGTSPSSAPPPLPLPPTDLRRKAGRLPRDPAPPPTSFSTSPPEGVADSAMASTSSKHKKHHRIGEDDEEEEEVRTHASDRSCSLSREPVVTIPLSPLRALACCWGFNFVCQTCWVLWLRDNEVTVMWCGRLSSQIIGHGNVVRLLEVCKELGDWMYWLGRLRTISCSSQFVTYESVLLQEQATFPSANCY